MTIVLEVFFWFLQIYEYFYCSAFYLYRGIYHIEFCKTRYDICYLYMCLHAGEANEVRAETEASTLAGRDRHGRRERVEESKCGERRRANR